MAIQYRAIVVNGSAYPVICGLLQAASVARCKVFETFFAKPLALLSAISILFPFQRNAFKVTEHPLPKKCKETLNLEYNNIPRTTSSSATD